MAIPKFEDCNNIKYQIKIRDLGYASKVAIFDSSERGIIITFMKKTFIEYEVKIRAFIDNVFGEWSKIERFDRH